MNSSTTSAPPTNPYFHNPERAPYELGHLLLQLPENFSPFIPQPENILLKASAAVSHAYSANHVLMHGLESLGKMLMVVGANEEWAIDNEALVNLGLLIQHVAVEAQFMQETETHLSFTLQHQVKIQ